MVEKKKAIADPLITDELGRPIKLDELGYRLKVKPAAKAKVIPVGKPKVIDLSGKPIKTEDVEPARKKQHL
ncbi:MAG: hypothetical protein V1492_04815 [Candidatus Micrarchaeota archaeon]